MITIVVTTWPNHPRRVSYCEQTIRALQRNLSATGHELRGCCLPNRGRLRMRRGAARCWRSEPSDSDLEVHWRDAEPSLPGHLNDIVRSLPSPLWFYVQDDWELIRPLDIGPAADLLLAHDDLGGVRFWAATGYVGEFEGHLVIDPAAAWSYGDNPGPWHTRFADVSGRLM